MIHIEHLIYGYPGSTPYVFADFNLDIEGGKIYGLLGKNGTGKSTLLYLIAGLLRCGKGMVVVDGVDSSAREASALGEMFIVPEEFDLPPVTLEAYVSINEPFYPRFSRDVLKACLADFELTPDVHLKELSMGQKKKVYMSFALAANTRLLMMDEPTNGLDIPSKSQFRRVIANNMSEGRTVIISTHQVRDVESLLDHIIMLGDTGLLLDSSVADICAKYSFGFRSPGEQADDVIYSEPSIHGDAVITRRREGDGDTQLNLELLFNAVASRALR